MVTYPGERVAGTRLPVPIAESPRPGHFLEPCARALTASMDVIPLTDPGDTRLETFRHLRDAELLKAHGLFVAEGRFVVERILADPRLTIETLLLNRASLDALRRALEERSGGAAVFECPTQAFESITGFNFHRGCLALVRRLPAR